MYEEIYSEFADEHRKFKQEYKKHQRSFGRAQIIAQNSDERCCAYDIDLSEQCPRKVNHDEYHCKIHLDICKTGNDEYFSYYFTKQHKYDKKYTNRWRQMLIENKDQSTDDLFNLLINNFDEIEILYIYYNHVYTANYRLKKQHYCYHGQIFDNNTHLFEINIRILSANLIYHYFKLTKYINIDDQEEIINLLLQVYVFLYNKKNFYNKKGIFKQYIIFLENLYNESTGLHKALLYDLLKIILKKYESELSKFIIH